MSKATGGSAFPCLEATMTGIDSDGQERFDTEAHGGMTLRDYFAAQALPALINEPVEGETASTAASICHDAGELQDTVEALMAFAAYRLADAMLAERTK